MTAHPEVVEMLNAHENIHEPLVTLAERKYFIVDLKAFVQIGACLLHHELRIVR